MKTIAITMGEPGGIGPEVALKAASLLRGIIRPVLIGDAEVFKDASKLLDIQAGLRIIDSINPSFDPSSIEVMNACSADGFIKGGPTSQGGRASADAIRRAVKLALSGQVDAMATAPISKEALKMAGLKWPGHTEMLAELTAAPEFGMMLMSGGLRVMLTTIHVALKDVPGLITRQSVLRAIKLSERALHMLGIKNGRIAVAGLNPHAGEGGMFGSEEAEVIAPAIDVARKIFGGLDVSGPYPPDTIFHRANKGEFDMVVCMYHDQGLIPLKLIGFDTGVNATIGLPIIRTSPDHGTAYEIAWMGIADAASMAEAVKAAAKMGM